MLDLFFYIIAGAGVGIAVGLTGVGGGSLMTPILILTGVPSKVAIGTDLLYAAFTKSGAMYSHHRQGNINWPIVITMASGSLPASLLTTYVLKYWMDVSFDYEPILTKALGIMLVVTAIVVFFRKTITQKSKNENKNHWTNHHAGKVSFITGILLGILVTLSSVGAGAFGAALLLTLYPKMPALHVVGTDIAHAVPLTLIAGVGHLWNGNVDYYLLAGLLVGSLPAVHIASKFSAKVPNKILQPILASLLLIIGLKFLIL